MTTPLLLVLLAIVLLLVRAELVSAYASDQFCTGWGSWQRGKLYDQMNVDVYSTDAHACKMSLSSCPSSYYTPNQLFSLSVVPQDPDGAGVKVVLLGGAEFVSIEDGTRDGLLTTPTCADFDLTVKVAKLTFRAPAAGGNITVKALCGRLGYVHIADDIVLQPGQGVAPVPVERSEDPAFSFQHQLSSKVVLQYGKNATHLAVNMVYTGMGYVGLGVGRRMHSNVALVGLSPAANAGMSSVGLYRLAKRKRTGAMELLKGSSMLDLAGIDSASFSQLGSGKSVLSFTQLLGTSTPSMFRLAPADWADDTAIADVFWAVGAQQRVSKHKSCGTVLDLAFLSGAEKTATPTRSRITASPTTEQSGGDDYQQYFEDTTHAPTMTDDDDYAQGDEGDDESPQYLLYPSLAMLLVAGAAVAGCAVMVLCRAVVAIRTRIAGKLGPSGLRRHHVVPDYVMDGAGAGGGKMFTPLDSSSSTSTDNASSLLAASLLMPSARGSSSGRSHGQVISRAVFDNADHLTLLNGSVYDFSDYPGGRQLLGREKDITAECNARGLTKKQVKALTKYYVGELDEGDLI